MNGFTERGGATLKLKPKGTNYPLISMFEGKSALVNKTHV